VLKSKQIFQRLSASAVALVGLLLLSSPTRAEDTKPAAASPTASAKASSPSAAAAVPLKTSGTAGAKAAPTPAAPKEPPLKDSVLVTLPVGRHSCIARIDLDGKSKRFLSQAPGSGRVSSLPTQNKADDFGAVGSADGKWIAFFSRRSGALNLWLARSDGSNAEALTTDESDISVEGPALREQLAFSPDSTHLAFVMRGDLWVLSLRERVLHSLSTGQDVGALLWTPNSRWIIYTQGNSIKRVVPSGEPLEVLLSRQAAFPTLAWSGDADKGSLLFYGRGLQRLTQDHKVELLWPTVLTPNRVQSQPGSNDKGLVLGPVAGSNSNELYLVDWTKHHGDQVTQGGAEDALFLPDGKGFLFQRQGHLWRCGLDGRGAQVLTEVEVRSFWAGYLAPLECK
jgi:Tol biopolymer transport system component